MSKKIKYHPEGCVWAVAWLTDVFRVLGTPRVYLGLFRGRRRVFESSVDRATFVRRVQGFFIWHSLRSGVTRGRLLRVPAVSWELIFHERCAEGLRDRFCAQTTACCTRCISPALLTDGLDAWCDAVEVVAFASELSSGGVA